MISKSFTGNQFTPSVDHLIAVFFPEPTDGVKVLKGEPQRVHLGVTGRTHGIVAMRIHPLPQGAMSLLGFERRDPRGRRRGRRCENVLKDPFAAFDRRGSVRV